jgi:hypothetical protein
VLGGEIESGSASVRLELDPDELHREAAFRDFQQAASVGVSFALDLLVVETVIFLVGESDELRGV